MGGRCGGKFADFGLAFWGKYGIMLCLLGRQSFGEDFTEKGRSGAMKLSLRHGFWPNGVVFCAFFTFAAMAGASGYGGGIGTPQNPFQIRTAEQMNAIGAHPEDWNRFFRLMADLDLSDYDGRDGRSVFKRSDFRGTFDGGGHILSNLCIEDPEQDNVGLFGYSIGIIRNLGIVNVRVQGRSCVGALAGNIHSYGHVVGCFATGTCIGTSHVGGLVGKCDGLRISYSYSQCSVEGESFIGGLIGDTEKVGEYGTKSYFLQCYSTGRVSGSGTNIGGLLGNNALGSIVRCMWDTESSGQTSSAAGIGFTTQQMQDPNTYRPYFWDFIGPSDGPHEVWDIPEVGGYPVLWWQHLDEKPLPLFSGGDGSVESPFLISSAFELSQIGFNPRLMDKNFRMVSDIDGSGVKSYSIGDQDFPYNGNFEGGGFTISNASPPNGMIRYLGGSVTNLRLMNTWTRANRMAEVNWGTIQNCGVTGTRAFSGGVGDLVGGLVGSNQGRIIGCYSNIQIPNSDGETVGGLAGENYGVILGCYATGQVNGSMTVGGLVGYNMGWMVDCYATCQVLGNAYSRGSIDGDGDYRRGIRCYSLWGDSSGIQRTSQQMKQRATFVGWGYSGWWRIHEGFDYPHLAWEGTEGDIIIDPLPWSGTGSEEDPFLISTATGLQTLGINPYVWDQHFRLTVNIDASTLGYKDLIAIGFCLPFTGSFDGMGHSIFKPSLYTEIPDLYKYGLFADVGQGGRIENLILDQPKIQWGRTYVGGIVGYLGDAAKVKDCHVIMPNIRAGSYVGGIVGQNYGGEISQCSVRGGEIQAGIGSGGLVGANRAGIISCSYSSANLISNDTCGGLVGINSGEVENCYAIGNVQGGSIYMSCGGLVGSNSRWISNCFSAGQVTGTNIGGLVGGQGSGAIDHSFWDHQSSGLTDGVGGVDPDPSGVTGLNTVDMQASLPFLDAGWDFVGEEMNGTADVWRMCGDGISYPRLSWEYSQGGDLACPDGVTMEDLMYLAGRWIANTPETVGAADVDGSGKVDLSDFEVLASNWMK
jgi:mucin-19